jgi:hypothetical protein
MRRAGKSRGGVVEGTPRCWAGLVRIGQVTLVTPVFVVDLPGSFDAGLTDSHSSRGFVRPLRGVVHSLDMHPIRVPEVR